MTLTPQQVAEKKFTSTRFKNGYDETEVDAFLDEVEAELTRLGEEAAGLRRQLESAQLSNAVQPDEPVATPTPVGDVNPTQGEMEEMLRRTLLLAQRTADEAVAEARAEAQKQVAKATAQAEALRLESEQRAAETEQAASRRATVSIAEAETRKRRLEEQISALRSFETDFRGRLRAYLELQLNDLDGASLVPGADPSGAADAPAAPAAAAVEPAPQAARADHPPVTLPDLPPLPSWMHADAGFATGDEPVGDGPQTPEARE